MAAHHRIATLTLAALLPLAACSSDDPEPPPTAPPPTSATTTTTAPTTTAPPTPEQEVEAAYLGIMDRYYESLADPNPEAPNLEADLTGPGYLRAVRRHSDLLARGQVARFGAAGVPKTTVLSVALQDQSASVLSCTIDQAEIVEGPGEVVIDGDKVAYLYRTDLRLIGSKWKINDQFVEGEWPDSDRCEA